MKKLALSLILAVVALSMNVSASNLPTSEEATRCFWGAWFKSPQANQKFQEGQSVYVNVHPTNYRGIKYMDLYFDGRHVRRESRYPYEWGRPGSGGDYQLHHLKKGIHKILVKITDKCGYVHKKYCTIYVEGGYEPDYCHFRHPLHDLHWLKKLHYKYPGYNICEYKLGHEILFKVYKCGVSHYQEYWYDCRGHLICRFNNGYPHPKVRRARFVKCWYDACWGYPGGGYRQATGNG